MSVKNCVTCKHSDIYEQKEPCASCENYQKWESPASQWISVEDRLPEKHRCVLVHLRWGTITTGVHNGRNWWDDLAIVNNDTVTHWMPLPEAPKEDKGNGME